MDVLSGFTSTLREFSEEINLPNLKLDNDFKCDLSINERFNVQLRFINEEDKWAILSELGEINENIYDKYYDCLLKANSDWSLTNGMTLSKIPETNVVTLGFCQSAVDLTLDDLKSTLDKFLTVSEQWLNNISQINTGVLPEELSAL